MFEYVTWRRKARTIPDEDTSAFYNVPLPHVTAFRYETETFMLDRHKSHFSLKFTLKGAEDFSFGTRKVKLVAGSALFANEGAEHDSSVRDYADCLSVHFPSDVAHMLVGSAQMDAYMALDGRDGSPVSMDVPQVAFGYSKATEQSLAGLIDVCGGFADCMGGEAVEAAGIHLAERALRDLMGLAPPWALSDIVRPAAREELIARVLRARAYIHDTAGANYDLDTLADIACLSKYHLLRVFADLLGVAPGAYARRLRLQAAKTALEKGKTCKQAANAAGYASVRRFKDAYLNLHGSLPVAR